MNALEWIRSKATTQTVEEFTVDGKTVVAKNFFFKGNLPRKMVPQLRNPKLVKTEMINEVLNLKSQFTTDHGFCEYMRTEYTFS